MTTVLHHELNSELCEKARNLGQHATQAETIEKALEWYVGHLQSQATTDLQPETTQSITDLFGKIDYYEDYDYKKIRNLR